MSRRAQQRLAALSLRSRLVIGIVVLLAAGLAAADVAGVGLTRSYQLQRIDQQLTSGPPRTTADGQWATTSEALCGLVAGPSGATPQLPTNYTIGVLDGSGRQLCRLPQQPTTLGTPDFAGMAGSLDARASSLEPSTVPSAGRGAPWRVQVLRTTDGYVVVGISLADAFDVIARLQLVMALVSVVILVLAGIGGLMVVKVGLRPLTQIEDTADAIARGDLSRRIAAPPPNTEVGRLAGSLNSMLGQIERGFDERVRTEDRLRQFLADASHELRTPLATIRGHAEMYRQGVASTPSEIAVVMNRIESESIRMGDLVNDLLVLARLDSGPDLVRQPVDLLAVAADAVVDARAREPGRPIVLSTLTEPPWLDVPPVVSGDEPRIRQVLANLMANVLRYTPPGSPVDLVIGVGPAGVELRVTDHGPGLAPGTAERVFERFYRDDYGRARSSGGTGLGLSIVSGLMAAHGGTVAYEDTPGGGSTFVVTFPAVSG
ncbi:sensor histidine kinase [uncultured Friedmanniella sp.]|uniref:sensor histidine kinase n=1 Tax=uncultured Friedmanniella sp. TaxID=335381 RepID=UPI0035CA897D